MTYLGDGVLDLRAARQLGIEFVGAGEGERGERLQSAGVETVFPDLNELRAMLESSR